LRASHRNRKPEAEVPFQAAVPQEMRIDCAVDERQAQARGEVVFQLFPDKFSVRFLVFHGSIQSWDFVLDS